MEEDAGGIYHLFRRQTNRNNTRKKYFVFMNHFVMFFFYPRKKNKYMTGTSFLDIISMLWKRMFTDFYLFFWIACKSFLLHSELHSVCDKSKNHYTKSTFRAIAELKFNINHVKIKKKMNILIHFLFIWAWFLSTWHLSTPIFLKNKIFFISSLLSY